MEIFLGYHRGTTGVPEGYHRGTGGVAEGYHRGTSGGVPERYHRGTPMKLTQLWVGAKILGWGENFRLG